MTYYGPRGHLLYVKGHNHHNLLIKALFIGTSASALGMACPLFCKSNFAPLEPEVIALRDLGYETFAQFGEMLYNRTHNVPMCTLLPRYAIVDGVGYDRAPFTECSNWTFVNNTNMTSVTMMQYHSEHTLEPWMRVLPKLLPMHSNWHIFITTDYASCYIATFGSSLGNVVTNTFGSSLADVSADRRCTYIVTDNAAKAATLAHTTSYVATLWSVVLIAALARCAVRRDASMGSLH